MITAVWQPRKNDALRNVDFAAISFDSLDPAKMDYIKGVKGAFEKAMHSVETLKKEGINVSVTPTISQLNLGEIVDITNHFTKMEVPVWYCLYNYDITADENQLFRIGKPMDEFVIKDKQAMVNLCDSLIEMKKKNKRILMTTKLLKAMRSLYAEDRTNLELPCPTRLLHHRPLRQNRRMPRTQLRRFSF